MDFNGNKLVSPSSMVIYCGVSWDLRVISWGSSYDGPDDDLGMVWVEDWVYHLKTGLVTWEFHAIITIYEYFLYVQYIYCISGYLYGILHSTNGVSSVLRTGITRAYFCGDWDSEFGALKIQTIRRLSAEAVGVMCFFFGIWGIPLLAIINHY